MVVQQISDYITKHSLPDEEILVFETGWAKIGPYVYYLSERAPPIKNLFFFPWKISNSQVSELNKILELESLRYVIFIGPEPFHLETQEIYKNVDNKCKLVYAFSGDFRIYTHLRDQIISVKIYET